MFSEKKLDLWFHISHKSLLMLCGSVCYMLNRLWFISAFSGSIHVMVYTKRVWRVSNMLCVIKKLGLTDSLVVSELSLFDVLHQWSTECKVCASSLASFCWGNFGKHGALTFSPLTMPTAVVHYYHSWRKSRLSLMSYEQVVCHCDRSHGDSDDDVDR
jgi:hypothetical protein